MLTDISSGFQTSTTETVLFVAVLGFIILGLLAYQIFGSGGSGKKKTAKTKHWRSTPASAPARPRPRTRRDLIELGRMEKRTLSHLAWFLKDQRREDKLIEDDKLLVRVARQGIKEGIVTESEVLRLLHKLEVSADALETGDHATDTIPAGTELSISDRNLNIAAGNLESSAVQGLHVHLTKGHKELQTGSTVEVVAGGGAGLYRFHTSVLQRTGKDLLLQHTRHVERVQRRKYRRRAVRLPVEVRLPGQGGVQVATESLDVSVGGAALKNRRKKIATGARVELVIDAGGSSPVTVGGIALRTSRRGKTVHISFGTLDEQTRHRLFRKLVRLGAQGHR